MTSLSTSVPATSFINVQVIVTSHINPATGKTVYDAKFLPEAITVRERDTVVNYQIISPTAQDIQFKYMTVSPKHNHQLSSPSISRSGKLVTFSNANTEKEKLNITLHFITKDKEEFEVDPEIINDPHG